MNSKLYSDRELAVLQQLPKRIINPRARWLEKPRERPAYRQRTFQASGQEDEKVQFSIYQRQNLNDESDFSCGILYIPAGAPTLTMARYNGPSHVHGDIVYQSHIHRASENAIAAGKKPESQAEASSRFQTLQGALACLMQDFNLIGLEAQDDDQLRMFQ